MNNRITSQRRAEAIAQGFALIPPGIRQRLEHVAFFTGDPVFAGLHHAEGCEGDPYGRSLRNTAHHCDPEAVERPAAERRSTVVLPSESDGRAWLVVHELGHALDYLLGKPLDYPNPNAPVTEYATTNLSEGFAEAFAAWVLPRDPRAWDGPEYEVADGWSYWEGRQVLLEHDPETVALFEALAS